MIASSTLNTSIDRIAHNDAENIPATKSINSNPIPDSAKAWMFFLSDMARENSERNI